LLAADNNCRSKNKNPWPKPVDFFRETKVEIIHMHTGAFEQVVRVRFSIQQFAEAAQRWAWLGGVRRLAALNGRSGSAG